ncbi:hypothetical protein ACFQ2M_15225 [Kitasatospora saccharophila]|uniref:hypothetical protein n=1 Tax=Kitasatospora saccharophila TaxID=407973 RepID=UPI00362B9E66
MSEPWTEPPTADTTAAPAAGDAPASPKSLLEQMQELLASINTDLAGLDSDLRSSPALGGQDTPADGSPRS